MAGVSIQSGLTGARSQQWFGQLPQSPSFDEIGDDACPESCSSRNSFDECGVVAQQECRGCSPGVGWQQLILHCPASAASVSVAAVRGLEPGSQTPADAVCGSGPQNMATIRSR